MKKSTVALLLMAAISASAPFARIAAAGPKEKLDSGKAVVANPKLVPQDAGKLSIPDGATLEQKIDILIKEIEKLKFAAMRSTLIVTAELERGEKGNRGGAKVSISGGKLASAISGTTDKTGTCVFILEPLAPGDPDYTLTISKNRYVDAIVDFRIDPGAVVTLPVRVELSAAERDRRINPLPPPQ